MTQDDVLEARASAQAMADELRRMAGEAHSEMFAGHWLKASEAVDECWGLLEDLAAETLRATYTDDDPAGA